MENLSEYENYLFTEEEMWTQTRHTVTLNNTKRT